MTQQTTTRYYAEFQYPGTFLSESSTRAVDDPQSIEWPERAYSCRTFARTVMVIDGEELRGKARDYSPTTYRGEVFDLERVKREHPDKRILIQNMQGNGYDRVVRTAFGQLFPINDTDIVISPETADV